MKRTVPFLITMVAGLFMLLAFFVPHPDVRGLYTEMQTWAIVVVGFTYVLGVANLLRINTRHVARRERDWPFKIVLIVGLLGTMAIGFYEGIADIMDPSVLGYSETGSRFQWIYLTFYSPMSATMFALLAFFIASAAFRAFRARNVEATLMLATAIVVMLGVIPVGEWIHPGMTDLKDWILAYPNNAGRRAILIGAALGAVATGLRVILGVERSHLGHD